MPRNRLTRARSAGAARAIRFDGEPRDRAIPRPAPSGSRPASRLIRPGEPMWLTTTVDAPVGELGQQRAAGLRGRARDRRRTLCPTRDARRAAAVERHRRRGRTCRRPRGSNGRFGGPAPSGAETGRRLVSVAVLLDQAGAVERSDDPGRRSLRVALRPSLLDRLRRHQDGPTRKRGDESVGQVPATKPPQWSQSRCVAIRMSGSASRAVEICSSIDRPSSPARSDAAGPARVDQNGPAVARGAGARSRGPRSCPSNSPGGPRCSARSARTQRRATHQPAAGLHPVHANSQAGRSA